MKEARRAILNCKAHFSHGAIAFFSQCLYCIYGSVLADKSPTLLFHSALHFEAGIIERTGLKENGAQSHRLRFWNRNTNERERMSPGTSLLSLAFSYSVILEATMQYDQRARLNKVYVFLFCFNLYSWDINLQCTVSNLRCKLNLYIFSVHVPWETNPILI